MTTNFKSFLLEYLTDEQRAAYGHIKVTAKARKASDHFFGKNNDKVVDNVDMTQTEKSDAHKMVEKHIGHEMSIDHYKAGIMPDPKYKDDPAKVGRTVRFGKMITDPRIKHAYDTDTTRSGKGAANFTSSTHRGVEVAGQTNPEPNEQHPTGHSWPTSCKNIEDGINNHYLPKEIKQGTVVHFVHDHTGKEIYRATIHPRYNDKGHSMYHLDAEYGVSHPSFTASAHKVVDKLNDHKNSEGIFHLAKGVYNDSRADEVGIHPNAGTDTFKQAFRDHHLSAIRKAIVHKNMTADAVHDIVNDKDSSPSPKVNLLRQAKDVHVHTLEQIANEGKEHFLTPVVAGHHKTPVHSLEKLHHVANALEASGKKYDAKSIHTNLASNPNLPPHLVDHYVEKAKDDNQIARGLLRNYNLTGDQIDKIHSHGHEGFEMSSHLVAHENTHPSTIAKMADSANHDMISTALLSDKLPQHYVDNLVNAKSMSELKPDHLTTIIRGNGEKIKPHHIDKLVNHAKGLGTGANYMAQALAEHSPHLQAHHIDTLVKHGDDRTAGLLFQRGLGTEEHVMSKMGDRWSFSNGVKNIPLHKDTITSLIKGNEHPDYVKGTIFKNPNFDHTHADHMVKHGMNVDRDLLQSKHVKGDTIHHAIKSDGFNIDSKIGMLRRNPNITKDHLEKIHQDGEVAIPLRREAHALLSRGHGA